MEAEITELRKQVIEQILTQQDESFRWGFSAKQALERPEYLYYSPNFRSTLWTLLLLADIQAPIDLPQVKPSILLVVERFYDPDHGIFRLLNRVNFPIPCLNGNMIYLLQYFEPSRSETLERTISFFAAQQRFDDGDPGPAKTHPYSTNISCYGKHTCFWGVTKLLKGLSFIPKSQRTRAAQELIEKCIDFVLQHEVCFSSHHREKFLHGSISQLAFPNFYKSDFLEILWLLTREEVRDARMARTLDLLRSRRKADGTWELEKPMNIIASIGQKGCTNAFITARANQVLEFYGD